LKKFIVAIFVLALVAVGVIALWARQPIINADQPSVEFLIKPGSSVRSATRQIANAGVPVQPIMMEILIRVTGNGTKIKAGSYELKPGTTPLRLVNQLVRGEHAQESVSIIEGWTFMQMRQAIAAHTGLKHETSALSEKELLAKINPEYKTAEGLFFPDTYRFAKGSSDLQIYKLAHVQQIRKLNDAWAKRDPALPYKTPYEALIMASIIEKETGQRSERNMIAAVFVNRLKRGMLLQTDPTVIYGMGEQYQGNIRKRDLQTDTPYNTYTRAGLPPTPIALAGAESLDAAFNPAETDALYFVSRGNGTSVFSSNLAEHNAAVNKYQR
jgi:UPF0755 protein